MSRFAGRSGFAVCAAALLIIGGGARSPAAGQSVIDTTPGGMVAFFPETECPSGWTASADLQGRFLMAVSDSSEVGKTVGTPLAEGELPTSHTHTFQTTVSLDAHGCACNDGGAGWTGGAKSGSHDVPKSPPGTTGAHETYSYTQILACERDKAPMPLQSDNYAQNMVAFFNTSACPQGWEQFKDTSGATVNGVFAIPFSDPGDEIGTVSGPPLTPGSEWTHSHSFKSSISVSGEDLQAASGTGSSGGKDGTYEFSAVTSTETIQFPYLQLLLCKKTAYSDNTLPTDMPQNILMFYAEASCPDGWQVSPSGFNRPLLGLPAGGTPNETVGDRQVSTPGHAYWHDHAVAGSVELSSHTITVDKGCSKIAGQKILCDGGHAIAGSYSFSSDSYWDGALPYLTLALCQPKI